MPSKLAIKAFTKLCQEAGDFLIKLGNDPLKFVPIAYDFANGTIGRAVPGFFANAGPGFSSANGFSKYLESKGPKFQALFGNKAALVDTVTIKGIKVPKRISLSGAVKFLGLVAVAFQITTTVFEAVANSGKWANVVSKAVFAAGAGFALGAIVSSATVSTVLTTAMTSALSSVAGLFGAAAASAPAVPVAVALAAAGIVVVAGVALGAAFNALIGLIFGSSTQDSISISMSRGLIMNLDKSITKSLSVSMYP